MTRLVAGLEHVPSGLVSRHRVTIGDASLGVVDRCWCGGSRAVPGDVSWLLADVTLAVVMRWCALRPSTCKGIGAQCSECKV